MTNSYYIRIVVDTSSAVKSLDNIAANLEKLQARAERATNFFRSMFLFNIGKDAVKDVVDLSDAFIDMQNKVKAASSKTDVLADSMDKVFAASNRARTDVGAFSKTVLAISGATATMNLGFDETVRMTETLSKMLRLGGATTIEAKQTLLQYGQALRKGKLDHDEFRTVMTNAVELQRALAKTLGISTDELAKYSKAGKITRQVMVDALVNGADEVDTRFAGMTRRVSDSWAALHNAAIKFVGGLNINEALSPVLLGVAENFDVVGKAATVAATVLSVYFAHQAVSAAISAIYRLTAAMLTNPFTALLVGITAAASALYVFGKDMQVAEGHAATWRDVFVTAWNDVKEVLSDVGTAIANAFGSMEEGFSATDDAAHISVKDIIMLFATMGDSVVKIGKFLRDVFVATFGGITAAVSETIADVINVLLDGLNAAAEKAVYTYKKVTFALGVSSEDPDQQKYRITHKGGDNFFNNTAAEESLKTGVVKGPPGTPDKYLSPDEKDQLSSFLEARKDFIQAKADLDGLITKARLGGNIADLVNPFAKSSDDQIAAAQDRVRKAAEAMGKTGLVTTQSTDRQVGADPAYALDFFNKMSEQYQHALAAVEYQKAHPSQWSDADQQGSLAELNKEVDRTALNLKSASDALGDTAKRTASEGLERTVKDPNNPYTFSYTYGHDADGQRLTNAAEAAGRQGRDVYEAVPDERIVGRIDNDLSGSRGAVVQMFKESWADLTGGESGPLQDYFQGLLDRADQAHKDAKPEPTEYGTGDFGGKQGSPIDDKAVKAREKAYRDYLALEGRISSVGKAEKELYRDENVLNKAESYGFINKAKHAELLGLLREQMQDLLHPYDALLKNIDREIVATSSLSGAWNVNAAVLKDITKLRQEGIKVSTDEIEQLRERMELAKGLQADQSRKTSILGSAGYVPPEEQRARALSTAYQQSRFEPNADADFKMRAAKIEQTNFTPKLESQGDKYAQDIQRIVEIGDKWRAQGVDENTVLKNQALLLESVNKEYDVLDKRQTDLVEGITQGWDKTFEEMSKTAAHTAQFIQEVFGKISDAIVEFVTTGQFHWDKFMLDILAGLSKVATNKLISGLMGLAGGAIAPTGNPLSPVTSVNALEDLDSGLPGVSARAAVPSPYSPLEGLNTQGGAALSGSDRQKSGDSGTTVLVVRNEREAALALMQSPAARKIQVKNVAYSENYLRNLQGRS